MAFRENAAAALEERGDDLYETPPEATRAFLKAFGAWLPDVIWEPACGPGAIVRELRAAGHVVIASDLVDYRDRGLTDQLVNVDFEMERAMPGRAQAIVTNPPYKRADHFVLRALELAPKVAMLLRLAFIANGLRVRGPVLDGGSLMAVCPFRSRLPMMHRDGWDGPRKGSQTDFAWFVWERGYDGPPMVKRLDVGWT